MLFDRSSLEDESKPIHAAKNAGKLNFSFDKKYFYFVFVFKEHYFFLFQVDMSNRSLPWRRNAHSFIHYLNTIFEMCVNRPKFTAEIKQINKQINI